MEIFHQTTCVCETGMSKGCQSREPFPADFPEGQTTWTCPHCGGTMRQATREEIDSWRAHLEAQAEMWCGRERPRRNP